jgi:DNA 3'-phosphatase
MAQDLILDGWVEFNGGLIARFPKLSRGEPEFKYHANVAGFNLDNTIINSNPKLVANVYEFELTYQSCIARLSELNQQNYSIVVISDQVLITKGIISIEELQIKFDFFANMLFSKGISIIGIFTTKNNCYKKPHTWTWKFLTELYRSKGANINIKESMYVGNLAGRLAKAYHNRDPDYVDRAFAYNIGITFKVPEQIFRNNVDDREFAYHNSMTDKEKDEFIEIELERYKQSCFYSHKNLYEYCLSQSNRLYSINPGEKPAFIIIMIGPPCSGKTRLSGLIAANASKKITDPLTKLEKIVSPVVVISEYYYVDDKKVTNAERTKIINNFIQDGRTLIIDGSYPSHASRDMYLKKAAEYKLPVIFIKLNPTYKICRQFNYIKLEKSQDKFREPLSDARFKKYKRLYQQPDVNKYMRLYPGLKCMTVDMPTIIIPSVKEFRNIY